MKRINQIAYSALVLAILSLLWQWKVNLELKEAYCDIADGFTAERKSYVENETADQNSNLFFSAKYLNNCD